MPKTGIVSLQFLVFVGIDNVATNEEMTPLQRNLVRFWREVMNLDQEEWERKKRFGGEGRYVEESEVESERGGERKVNERV